MMRNLTLLIVIAFFSSVKLYAQDSTVVVVEIKDDGYFDPIKNASVVLNYGDSTIYATTRSKGIVTALLPKGITLSIGITHRQYEGVQTTRKISERYKYDTISYNFNLKLDRVLNLDEVVIPAPGLPQVVYGSSRLHVSDFELLENGKVMMLTYPKRLKKGSELVLFDGRKVLNSFKVPSRAYEMVRDYRGNPHVLCETEVYGIHAKNSTIQISTLDKEYYTKYLAPIIDTNRSKLYFSTFNPDYPAFEYFSFDREDSTYSKIMGIQDDLMMELYRAEYKWADIRTKLWAKNKEIKTGVDAEIWVGANYFTRSIYYKEAYSPLFHRNDSLFVFDYYKDKLFTFNADGEALDSVEIYHHYTPRKTGWKNQLIQDSNTGEIYALFDRAGYTYMGWIDTKTGEIKNQVKLEHRYVEKVAVQSNFVYYIYRPFESIQKKYLYKERLPYDFGRASVHKGDEIRTLSDREEGSQK